MYLAFLVLHSVSCLLAACALVTVGLGEPLSYGGSVIVFANAGLLAVQGVPFSAEYISEWYRTRRIEEGQTSVMQWSADDVEEEPAAEINAEAFRREF